jgi:hypothetical protein
VSERTESQVKEIKYTELREQAEEGRLRRRVENRNNSLSIK